MTSNYHHSENSILTELFTDLSSIGQRDKDAIVQMVLNFSAALNLTEKVGKPLCVVETGSGFSTRVFEFLLGAFPKSTLVSIDLGGKGALNLNSRSVEWGEKSKDVELNLVQAPSIELQLLERAWGMTGELNWDSSSLAASDIEPFIDYRHDDRRVLDFENSVGNPLSAQVVLREVRKLSKGEETYFHRRRYPGDEFDALEQIKSSGGLRSQLKELAPDLVFLDSGEFSTLAEFLVIDEMAEAGQLLIVQDILFPKSVKGFLIGSLILKSPRWQMLWIDKSTAQGIFVARRIR